VVIAGVRVPCAYRVIAHSDGDVVLHRCATAMLCAVGRATWASAFSDR